MSGPGRNDASFDVAAYLRTLPRLPGVYRMLNAKGEVIYVGKARSLKSRVSSYFRSTSGQSRKNRLMLPHVHAIEVTVTHTEAEALLLENTLIKAHKPRYNICLRDDKSYPYIYLSGDSDYPRLGFHRGARRAAGRYFGPYPSAGAVRQSLQLMQKLFPVRQCEDSFFRNRSRPCLQYQIKRCTAPCVGLVGKARYQEDVRLAVMFLEGKSGRLIDELVLRMEQAAVRLEYEEAARIRDQIASLRRVQEKQYVSGDGGDVDVIAAVARNGASVVEVLYIRGGRVLGNKTFYPRHTGEADSADVLEAFIPQYYVGRDLPGEVWVNRALNDRALLEQALSVQAGRKLAIGNRPRGGRIRWLQMAETNARHALEQLLAGRSNMLQRFEALQDALKLDSKPERLECFDISHTLGEAPVASCVVFDLDGPVKNDYRRFNVDDVTPGDDYGAMRQALSRRYTRLQQGEGRLPDVLLIDGGKGQVSQARAVLEELQVDGVLVVGVAKGTARKAGAERLFLSTVSRPTILPADSPALHLIQQVRDEAHRFAVSGHRRRRARARSRSPLEAIPGLGPKRRRVLLTQFGGLQGVARAGVDDLAGVQGISRTLAQRIYDVFHGSGSSLYE
ncbi:MAG TPA: excinuclease ABC subunit UvrC [Gammaproteobacteria bacterium]|nr:excinuclease ABC subunit UvrC [Gammaproteobacteria bacterium]